jgi:hypothetical protein
MGLKLNEMHQLAYADDVILQGGNTDTVKKMAETLTDVVRRLI